MRRRRSLATLLASLTLHGGALLAVALFLSREPELGALFIDLSEWAEAGAGGREATAAPPPQAAGREPGGAPVRSSRGAVPAPGVSARSREAEPRASAPVASSASPEPVAADGSALAERQVETSEPRAVDPPVAAALRPVPGPAGVGASTGGGAPRSAGGEEQGSTRAGAPGGLGSRGAGVGSAPNVSRGFALAVPGSGTGGPGAEYGPYLGKLRQRVQESLTYPLAARRRGLAGTVHIELVIRPDGSIGTVTVADSSSHALLDDAAVEAVKGLTREPFPPDVPARALRIRLPVVFTLR